jgi:DNA-binding NarL/FixJ family response regulator
MGELKKIATAVAFCLFAAARIPANEPVESPPIRHVFLIALENKNFPDTFASSRQDPYLRKALPQQGALAAVRGQRIFQPGPAMPPGTQTGNLTAMGLTGQEAAILRLVAGGYSNKEVARHLSVSVGTVKNHMSDILCKLDARDRTHAVLKAIAGHLLSEERPTISGSRT